MRLPTKDGEYAMPESVFGAYLKLYPSAEHEFARMLIWLETNPARRPVSPKSAPRFVENWFKRVPRIAPQRQARIDTLAALTGRSGNGDGRDDWAAVRSNDRDVRRAEDVIDVDWRGPADGSRNVGADVIELPARRLAFGG